MVCTYVECTDSPNILYALQLPQNRLVEFYGPLGSSDIPLSGIQIGINKFLATGLGPTYFNLFLDISMKGKIFMILQY